jgi:hydroxymethylpyrimidine pyrophosphatase-like HAD family hydrolase
MRIIQLLATDLDGTLIGSATEFPLYTSFREKVRELRQNYGTIWVACTGRDLGSFKSFFSPLHAMGMSPDFVVVSHAYIFEKTRIGYMPHLIWNLRIAYIIWVNNITAREAITDWHDTITGVSGGVSTLKRTKSRVMLRFDSPDAARVASEVLQEKLRGFHHLQVFHAKDEVDVRTVPFTKGLSVSELARHLGIDKEEILTIGNGHNDISMLDRKVAGMVACPANSEPEVMKVVHREGGHISREKSLGGVMDSINAYQSDKVDSSLPGDYVDPVQKTHEKPRRSSRRRRSRMSWRTMVLIGLAVYVVLLVFASYGLIPYVSGLIVKPYHLCLRLLEKMVLFFVR